MRPKILTYNQFINEASPSSSFSDEDFKFDDSAPTNKPAADPLASASGTSPDQSIPSDPNSTPSEGGEPGADPLSGEGGEGGEPSADPLSGGGGGGDMGGMPSGGGGGSMPGGADPLGGGGDTPPETPFEPTTQVFKIIIDNPEVTWDHKYPDGGGTKKMKTFEIAWDKLEKWIKDNKLDSQTADISNFLTNDENSLNREVKLQLKAAIENNKLGVKDGDTDVEYDSDKSAYTGDIHTVILNFESNEKPDATKVI